MSFFRCSLNDPFPAACLGAAATIGNFDGVHLGHQALVAQTRAQANALHGPSLAVTFDPHPLELLRPDDFQPVLTTLPERAELLQADGIDHVLALAIDAGFLRLSARDFFTQVVVERLQARTLVEGFNFAFGRQREGTTARLQELGREFHIEVTLVPPQELEGQPVSSSRVRNALLAGEVAQAATFLGRPYRLTGTVQLGQQRGKTLGFPTANLHQVSTLIPGHGVYAVRAKVHNVFWPAAANIGPNPTFGEQNNKVEVHLIGFQGNLYGQTLSIDFVERLRGTRKFQDVKELVAQMKIDVEHATAACGLAKR